jgi:adenylosuccinate synthase
MEGKQMKVDMIVGLSYGDEAKKKCANFLLKKKNYTHSCRASGGPNCGGTVYHNGKKFVLHHLPAGVFHNIPSILGSGCLVHPKTFLNEIENLEKYDINAHKYVKISSNAHIITEKHIGEDIVGDKIGSTKTGIMPAYRDKYARCGKRAKDCPELKEFICDQYKELFENEKNNILIEGAQGMWLCPDHGFYPYVTSSPPTVSYALHSLGLPPQSIHNVYGVAKAYETYVGAKRFQPDDGIFAIIQKRADEFGATTGRPRQVNWMNVDLLRRAASINGITHLIINKMDILVDVDKWVIRYDDGSTYDLRTEENFKNYFMSTFQSINNKKVNIQFSYSPKEI